jgi:hypothetical protein
MLRCEFQSHTYLAEGYDVLLLGGKQFFDNYDPNNIDSNVDASLSSLLKARVGGDSLKQVRVAAVPTELSHVYQQYLLFRDFYQDYRPKVVVMGVTAEEAESVLHLPARQVIAAAEAESLEMSALFHLRARANRGTAVLQSPKDLAATLGELAQTCRESNSTLILALDAAVPPDYVQAVQGFAAAAGIPVVPGFDLAQGTYPVRKLADAIASVLPR